MTQTRAERIIGFPIAVVKDEPKPGWATAIAAHPVYGYALVAADRNAPAALNELVRENYIRISAIVRREQNFRCLECGRLCALEVDHIEMRSHGRDDSRSNLRALGSTIGGCGCHDRRHGIKVAR